MGVDRNVPVRPLASEQSSDREFGLNAGTLIAAGVLIGFGVILWIAANWSDWSNQMRFTLVGGSVLASALAAVLVSNARVAATLAGVLAIGGLLALFGQTYQTGADPWQLFATWAALALPWVIAARHDAVWSLWVVVLVTALTLWGRAMAGFSWQISPSIAGPVWLLGIAASAVLSPWSGLQHWIGRTTWAFRLVAAWTAGLVVADALPALFESSGSTVVLLSGFLVLGLGIAVLMQLKPLELGLLSIFVLAFDVMVIAAIVRAMFFGSNRGGEIGSTLLAGLIAAGIFAGSAAWLLDIARSQGSVASAGQVRSADVGRTWPVIVMTSIGALIAAIPFLVVFSMVFGVFLSKGPGPYVLGGAIIAALAMFLPQARTLGFGQQFGVIALVLGLLLLGFGLFRDLSGSQASGVMMALSAALAMRLSDGWIGGLLGAVTAAFAAYLSQTLSGFPAYGALLLDSIFGWVIVAAVAGIALIVRNALAGGSQGGHESDAFDRFLSGFTAAALLGIIITSGRTFLFGAVWWGGGLGTTTGHSLWLPWTWMRALSTLLAVAASVLLLQRNASLRTATGFVVACVVTGLSSLMTALGAAVLIIAAAAISNRRALACFAAFTALWVLGSFYYWLGWPLVEKSYLMLGLGGVLAAVAWFSGVKLPALPSADFGAASMASIAAALIAVSTVATAGVVGNGVWQKERVIKTGRTVFISLAPVDPRSLMQGDYMALRFALPAGQPSTEQVAASGGLLRALATVDGRRVATVKSYVTGTPSLAADEILIEMVAKNGQWIVGTDAWFFKEGTGSKYQPARFGEFRIEKDGKAVLVGLTNADMQALR